MTEPADGMPERVLRCVEDVLDRSGLTGAERADVRAELLAHFEDGLEAGRDADDLIASFGEAIVAGDLIGAERGGAGNARRHHLTRLSGSIGRDVRLALRRLRKSPLFTFTAVVSLAIGIGANTAIFTLVNALLMRRPPYVEPERLYDVFLSDADFEYGSFSYPDFEDVRDGTGDLISAATATEFRMVERDRDSDVETLMVAAVNGDNFSGLGVGAALGRVLGPADDVTPGAHPVVMLGWSYWQRAYRADPSVIGRDITLSGRPYTIVGVAPREFEGTIRGLVPDVYAPIMMVNTLSPDDADPYTTRNSRAIFVKVRLADGVTRAALEARLATVVRNEVDRGIWGGDVTFRLVPTSEVLVYPPVDRFIRMGAWLLSAVVALVLLIACANLAGFLLAKAVDRRREMAVQLSLGATRGALVSQLMVETLLLGLVAGCAGFDVSMLALRWLLHADLPVPIPLSLDLSPDATVLGYGLLVSGLAGAVFGLGPALLATRTRIAAVLRDETAGGGRRGRATLRGLLVAGQVAVSVVLLAMSGLLTRSFRATQTVDPGFGGTPSALVWLTLRSDRWDAETGQEFIHRLHERFNRIPGVERVALTGRLHLDPLNNMSSDIVVAGIEPPPGRSASVVDWTPVDPPFFEVMGIPILEGRGFTESDRRGTQAVAVVNRAMASRFWPDGNAVGATFRYATSGDEVTVVGIAADAKVRQIGESPRPQLYRPFAQQYSSSFTVIANVSNEPDRVALEMARAAHAMDPNVFTWDPKSMARHLATQLIARRLAAWVVSAFAVLALALATVGLWGLISYSVAQRRHEVGIRLSLGASRASIMRLLLGSGMRLVAVGTLAGLLAALLLARLAQGLLYGVGATDPLTFGVVVLALLIAAFIAACVPAAAAARTDPGKALRAE